MALGDGKFTGLPVDAVGVAVQVWACRDTGAAGCLDVGWECDAPVAVAAASAGQGAAGQPAVHDADRDSESCGDRPRGELAIGEQVRGADPIGVARLARGGAIEPSTSTGAPMILAGDEFADEHDLKVVHPEKQRDAVNFERLQDPWRRRVFDYTARLVRLRTSYPALAVNDTEFLHTDLNDGKRVLAWRRGRSGSDSQIVVVANFSDWANLGPPGAEYIINNWPATPPGKRWREMTQERDVPPESAGREPLAAREAKVYALVDIAS
jgi:Domain of unknown function (DUF3459)